MGDKDSDKRIAKLEKRVRELDERLAKFEKNRKEGCQGSKGNRHGQTCRDGAGRALERARAR